MESLQIDSVYKTFGERILLSGIHLSCECGQVVGLLGRNGSGKSTLLKIIFGTLDAENKFVKTGNTVVRGLSANIAYLPQERFLPYHLTVKTALQLTVDKHKIVELIDDSFIAGFVNNKIRNLSGGELRYLETRIILASSAKFILLDEPFSKISPLLIEKLIPIIKESSLDKGIIVSDHSYNNVLGIADKLYLLKDGASHLIEEDSNLIELGYLTIGML